MEGHSMSDPSPTIGRLSRDENLVASAFHPLADLFPLMSGDEFEGLVDDIKANGLRHPIVEMQGAILDGRNRHRACTAAGVALRSEEYTGTDPLAFVLSANLHRRHLNESQRAMVAAKLANMQNGQRKRSFANLQSTSVTQPAAAILLRVSPRSVANAKAVRDAGSVGLIKRVEAGEVPVSVAARIAKMPVAEQVRIEALPEPVLRGAVKKAERARRESDLGEATRAASIVIGAKLYSVIYADPPWRFEPYSRDTGMDRAADNHYPTQDLEAICAMRMPAANDAVLFL